MSDCNEWEELLGTGVTRKVLVQGVGDCPEHGHLVLFDWEGRSLLESGRVGTTFAAREKAKTRIGDGDEVPGENSTRCEISILLG